MIERLFVYGTLGPGRPNEHVMTAIGGQWSEGFVRGHLRAEGWGAEMGFPGIDLTPDGEPVHGFVFSSDNFAKHWQRLDEFEGAEYRRVITEVELVDGSKVQAYIYSLR